MAIEPEMCYTAVMKMDGFTLGAVKRGELGYYATDYLTVETYELAVQWANEMNEKLGVDKKTACIMALKSMRLRENTAYAPILSGKELDLVISLVEMESISDEKAGGWTMEMFDKLLESLRNTQPIPA